MRTICTAALVVLTAAWGASASADDAKEPETAKEKVICKSNTVTGSRLKKSQICMTKAQWADLADKTKQDIDNYSRTSGSKGPQSKNPLTGL